VRAHGRVRISARACTDSGEGRRGGSSGRHLRDKVPPGAVLEIDVLFALPVVKLQVQLASPRRARRAAGRQAKVQHELREQVARVRAAAAPLFHAPRPEKVRALDRACELADVRCGRWRLRGLRGLRAALRDTPARGARRNRLPVGRAPALRSRVRPRGLVAPPSPQRRVRVQSPERAERPAHDRAEPPGRSALAAALSRTATGPPRWRGRGGGARRGVRREQMHREQEAERHVRRRRHLGGHYSSRSRPSVPVAAIWRHC